MKQYREMQILKMLRKNPLIQQNEIAEKLHISRSRIAAHIMDLTRKGMIKGKGYILAEQSYCVVIGAMNLDIRGVASIDHPQPVSNPGHIRCTAGGVGRNIAHNLALLGQDSYLISVLGDDFYADHLIEQTRQAGVNVENCYRLHGHNTATYLSIADEQAKTIMAVNDTHIMQQLTADMLSQHRELLAHAAVVLADCNLTEQALHWIFTQSLPCPVFVDAVSEFKVERIIHWLDKIHTLKLSPKELMILQQQLKNNKSQGNYQQTQNTESTMWNEQNMHLAARWLHQQGVKQVFLYLDNDAVFYSISETEFGYLPATDQHKLDNFGADDAFMAGLIYCHLQEPIHAQNIHASAKFAVACATIASASNNINNPSLCVENILRLI